LLGFTLALPLAAVTCVSLLGTRRYAAAIGALAMAASLAPFIAADWLRTSNYKNDAILMTRLNWPSTYLPLYAPEFGGRSIVVSPRVADEEIRRFLDGLHPTLLITRPADPGDRRQLVRLRNIVQRRSAA